MKKVLISAYTCCPNSGSEPGNGWNWLMGYIQNGYEVHCVTSSKYQSRTESYLKEYPKENLILYYTDNRFSLKLLKIPAFGIYFHYFLWLRLARKKIMELADFFDFLSAGFSYN